MIAPVVLSALVAGLSLGDPIATSDPVAPSFELVNGLASVETFMASLSSPTGPQDGEHNPHLSYTYIEIGATEFDVDAVSKTADVYHLEASLALGKFYLIGRYENQDLDFMSTSADVLQLGVGLHHALNPNLDLFSDIQWIYNDVSTNVAGGDGSNSGYQVRAGPRWMLLNWLELNGELLYVDVEDRIASEDEALGWGVGARAHFLRLFSVGLEYASLEDDDEIGLDLRLSF